jgi:ribosomal protein L11 methyltransferase
VSWKTTLPCTRAEAEAIDAASDLAIEAVLMTTEEVDGDAARWRLDAYTDDEPDADMLAAIRALAPSTNAEPVVVELTEEDWVALSQEGLEPIREGRFVVHTSAHPVDASEGGRAFLIDAGRAFGTGHHATTSGCLAMLDGLAGERFESVIDFGTGTGLLAFAARVLWPEARVTGTDIDPVAVEVAEVNAAANGIDGVAWLVADGARSATIEAGAPYDLLIANILAGPLSAMAPEIAALAAPGATIVLSGLLATQAEAVIASWAECGCRFEARDDRGDWSILRLTAGAERFVPSGPPDPAGRDGWALDL